MVRPLVEDVTLVKDDGIRVHVRFKGGVKHSMLRPRPLACGERRQHPRAVAVEIDRLLEHHTDREVAALLNGRGIVSGTGKSFHAQRVKVIRRAHGLRSRQRRLRARGLLTLKEVAARPGVCTETVRLQRRAGCLARMIRES